MNQCQHDARSPGYPRVIARVVAGILIRGRVRALLEREKFAGRDIEWLESKGFLESIFTIKGDDRDVRTVYQTLIDAGMEP